MKSKLHIVFAFGLLAFAATGGGPARATIATVNFESLPVLATGPSIFVAVPSPQTITTPQATFTGGVVLGFATFFPAISFATPPNVYGTANFGNGLPEQLSIAIDPAFIATEVSFALFNGETFFQTYSVDAFKGTNTVPVAHQTLTSLPPNFNSGYGLVDLVNAAGIDKVTIVPVGTPSAWDFLIDTVGLNLNIGAGVPIPVIQPPVPPVFGHRHGHGEAELVEVDFGDDVNDIRGSVVIVPEPGTLSMMFAGVMLGLAKRRNRRRGRKSVQL